MLQRIILTILILFCLANNLIAENKPIAKIPFLFNGVHIYLKVKINEAEQAYVLFDTGASHNMIDKDYANSINLEINDSTFIKTFSGKVKSYVSKNNKLSLGRESLDNQGFTLVNNLARPIGRDKKYVAAIGGIFLFNYVVKINYIKRLLYLYNPKTYKNDGAGEVLNFKFRAMMPTVKGTFQINGNKSIQGDIAFDTGAATTSIIRPWAVEKFSVLQGVNRSVDVKMRGGSGSFSAKKIRIDNLSFGNQSIKNVPVDAQTTPAPRLTKYGDDIIGFIGVHILSRYHVTINYPKNQIVLEKNRFHSRPYIINPLGFKFKWNSDKNLDIYAVKPNGSAATAGIKSGDIITQINQKPVKQIKPQQLQKLFFSIGNKLSIKIIRKNKTIDIDYTVTDII